MTLTFTDFSLVMASPGPGNGLPILDSGGAVDLTDEQYATIAGPEFVRRQPTVLPYDSQDGFGRDATEQTTPVAVLENEHLRATFLLGLGGRLWSLTDHGRELLHQPDRLLHGNLALRKAWFSGGVEWNLGFTGHWPLTSEPVFAGRVAGPEGSDVLRMWAYERMLGLVWRIDAWLPPGSRDLYVRPVLTNRHPHDIPLYWWSNIAVAQVEGGRVLMPATKAWRSTYDRFMEYVDITPDLLRPDRAEHASDLFGQVPESVTQPWVAAVGPDGFGLQQASTSLLRARKLFVWGTFSGGERWQTWLGDTGRYAEIQAGLAPSQLHHLRFPAGRTWAWTEAYGAVSVPESYPDLPGAVLPPRPTDVERADQALAGVQRAEATVEHEGDGWGALDVEAGHLTADPATPFPESSMGDPQQPWLGLLAGEPLGDAAPVIGDLWRARIEASPESPARELHLGYVAHAAGRTGTARHHWQRSLELGESPGAWRALALTSDDPQQRWVDLARAAELAANPALHLESWVAALAAGHPEVVVDPARIAYQGGGVRQGRYGLILAQALVATGRLDEAGKILDSHLVVADLREGQLPIAEVWKSYQEQRGTAEPLPAEYDFRMRP